MFTDMVGYTLLMQKDEQKAKSLRDRHRQVQKEEVESHSGEILQYYGDGTLCIFNSSLEAVDCAIQIQKKMQKKPKIPLRIGIHTGDIVHDQEGIYGDGVNVASRIESFAIPGSVLISEKVTDDIKNHPSFSSTSMGIYELKNVEKPVEVYAITNQPLKVPKPEEIKGKGRFVQKSLAVLPFVNMSADAENEYFSDGITEEILNALAKVDGLQVTARTSSFAFKGKNMDLREIGVQLNVQHILEGSVRKAGNKVRITAQLINSADGYHLWSDTFDRKLEDIFEVQDEISQNIAHQLKEQLAIAKKEPLVKYATKNIEAYNLYLKGNFYWNKWSPQNVTKAIEYYKKAIAIQKDFVLPYTGLASCYIFLGITGNYPPQQAYPLAKELSEKALELDQQQEGSHVAMAMVKYMYEKDRVGAMRHFQIALELNQGVAITHHYYGMFLSAIGKLDQAVKEVALAHELDPLALNILGTYAEGLFFQNRYDEALQKLDAALELDPTYRPAWEGKGWIYVKMGELQKALKVFKKFQALTGSELKGLNTLGYVYAKMGQTEKVEDCFRKLEQRQQSEPNVDLDMDFAIIYAGLGDTEKLLKYLEQGLQKKMGGLWLATHPMWEDFRSDPRFQKLLKKYDIA